MEAPNPFIHTQKKEFPILIGQDNFNLSIIYSPNEIQFILNHKNENDESQKFEKSFTFDTLNKISKWFKIFDSLDEVFGDIIKLMENKQININIEDNIAKLIFNINMEKIKEFSIILDKKELSKDEIINNLIKENKELKNRLNNLEKRFNSHEEKFNNFEKNNEIEINKENNLKITKNEIWKSDIINEDDKKTLNDWINLNNDKTIKLLYKASRDGDS